MSFAGKYSATDCEECRRCREAGYQGAKGWFLGGDDALHNHLKERPRTSAVFNREDLFRRADPLEPTAEEMHIAAQLGLTSDAIRAQKAIDAKSEEMN